MVEESGIASFFTKGNAGFSKLLESISFSILTKDKNICESFLLISSSG